MRDRREHEIWVILAFGCLLTAVLNFFLLCFRKSCHWHVKTTSLQFDNQVQVKSFSFCFPAPLLMGLFWIKALCVLKVSGFSGSVADAASQISPVHTTYKQAQEEGWEITAYYPLLSFSDSQQTASLLSDAVITFRRKGGLFSLLWISYNTNEGWRMHGWW